MPELPEVETIRLGLMKYLIGHTITSIEVKNHTIFQGNTKNIEGAKVIAVRRFGKGLVIDLSNGFSLAIHIKLTGQLIYRGLETQSVKVSEVKVGPLPGKFTHVVFHLDKEGTLYYNDLRQFGWIKVISIDEVKNLPFFKELGPEVPINNLQDTTNKLTQDQFNSIISRSKLAIKPLIMDQKKMSGIGNIYANDGLYLAKIDPRRPANSLNSQEAQTLFRALLTVLKKGLEEGGSSELTYVNVLGQEGNYQNHTLIYGKQGEKCSRDGTGIKKFMLAGRGTYMCPYCVHASLLTNP